MRADGVFGIEDVPLLTAGEAASLDARAGEGGVPERALMENAGRAAAQVIHRLYPRGRVVAVVGGGNNGGDAIVALRSLHAWGRTVAWVPAGSSPPDPALFTGFELPALDAAGADAAFAGAGVLVDGILGTGAKGAPRDPAADMVRRMNASGRPIVALDIPSGVDPTTGAVPGEAVVAAVTIQFGWPKRGALLQPGRDRCGRLVAVEIGFPAPVPGEHGAALITVEWARARLPRRGPDAHKNAVGRVAVIAGRKGMAGAAVLCAHSAVRAGAGLVRVVSGEANRAVIQAGVPESLFIDRSDAAAVAAAVAASDAVLVGPALGTGAEGSAALDAALDGLEDRVAVLDADALTILAERGRVDGLGPRFVLTPHPGEMSRLTGLGVDALRAAPIEHARALAERSGAAVLLKGQPSVVAAPGAPVMVASVGSSDLAAAGMGDHLGGVVAAMAAAGAAPADAAALGLYYSGRAAELAGRGRGLTPGDVADRLRAAFDDPGPDRSPLELPFVVFDQPPRW